MPSPPSNPHRGDTATLKSALLTAIGVVAVYLGARRRGLVGWALAAGGGRLVTRGLHGLPAGSPLRTAADAALEVGLRRGELDQRAAARLRV